MAFPSPQPYLPGLQRGPTTWKRSVIVGTRIRTRYAKAARVLAVASTLALGGVWSGAGPAVAAAPSTLWFDNSISAAVTAQGTQFVDGYGRQIVLRGFNVSGEAKLAENGELPFAGTADAQTTAAQMRQLTGANTIRFLLSWAAIEPQPDQIDTAYLAKATAQIQAFADQGFEVFVDFHQDLYSRYLFTPLSWYTGDGAPQWVIAAGGYPAESCALCAVNWSLNMTLNAAVQDAQYDFWHNRVLTTSAGQIAVQDAFLSMGQSTLAYLKAHLSGAEFTRLVGVDPYNEPYAGKYDAGQTSQTWERDLLWPFYQRFRAAMDAAGWSSKAAFVEPNVFWNSNLSFQQQPGGLSNIGVLGNRYVFNAHLYDEAAFTGVLMPGHAGDGQYTTGFDAIRGSASALGTAAIVSEFGAAETGSVADKTPSILKAMYQGLDSGVTGANWWSDAAASGPVLSGTEWQWDVYSGKHDELMNGNPLLVQTAGDAWNGEDFSVVTTDSSLTPTFRQDVRVLDRLYPTAVAGDTLAFTYEDRAHDGSSVTDWNPVPSSMPAVAGVVGSGEYGVLVWRSNGGAAPTELHLPAAFTAANTTVISDLGTLTGLPAYAATGTTTSTPIAIAGTPGGGTAQRLLLSDSSASGTLHYALITDGSASTTSTLRTTAQQELSAWAAAQGFPSS